MDRDTMWREFIGKSIDEAMQTGLDTLNLTREQVEIQVLDEGSKGIFGLFGGKMARVNIRPIPEATASKPIVNSIQRDSETRYAPSSTKKTAVPVDDSVSDMDIEEEDPIALAQDFLQCVLPLMGVEGQLQLADDGERLTITIEGPNMGMLIGRRGETLDALQYLTGLAINKGKGHKFRKITLDTENYRLKRQQALEQLAQRMASKVQRTGQSVEMEPMNPYERRILHASLQDHSYVTTHSEGENLNRHVVISLK